jgi:hypothetical protein
MIVTVAQPFDDVYGHSSCSSLAKQGCEFAQWAKGVGQ